MTKATKRTQLTEALAWLGYLQNIAEDVYTSCHREWDKMYATFFMRYRLWDDSANPYYLNGDKDSRHRVWMHCFGPKQEYEALVRLAANNVRELSGAGYTPCEWDYYPKR